MTPADIADLDREKRDRSMILFMIRQADGGLYPSSPKWPEAVTSMMSPERADLLYRDITKGMGITLTQTP